MVYTILRFGLFSLVLWIGIGFSYAAISQFSLRVNPDTFAVGEPVDVEVRAIDADGALVADYVDDVFLSIKEASSVGQNDYTLPSDGYYLFLAKDQGSKSFSKGLIFKKAGTYTLLAERLDDNAVRGEATIVVTDPDDDQGTGSVSVDVTSPSSNTVIDRDVVDIMGVSSDLPNTPVFIELNGDVFDVGDVTTDTEGQFAVSVTGLTKGENTIVIQLKNADGDVVASSDPLIVVVEIDDGPLFSSFDRDPRGDLYIDQESTVLARVADRVTSLSLVVDGKPYPLDRNDDGVYEGVLQFQDPGTYSLSLKMYVDGDVTEKKLDDVVVVDDPNKQESSSVNVSGDLESVSQSGSLLTGSYGIGLIRYELDPLSPGVVRIVRDIDGDLSEYYTVFYGEKDDNLDKRMTVATTGLTLSRLSVNDITYAQVWPSSMDGSTLGTPSDALAISFHASSPTCVSKGITLRSEKRGSDYYLVWDAIDGATSYTIYRSDKDNATLADMSVVGNTTATQYQYPFDLKAKHEQYAYYAVQAECDSQDTPIVSGVEKVQVGPVSSALMVMLLVVGVYFLYRVNIYQE